MRLALALVLSCSCAATAVGCDDKKGGPPAPDPASVPAQRGAAPPPPADSAGKPGACKSGGGEIKDAVSAPLFPRTAAGYCVNPDGETQAFGEKAGKPIEGICSLFDGGCELYKKHGVKRTVRVDYVDGAGSPATVTADLSQFASSDHAYAMFTKRITSDEDPSRPDMPKKADIGVPAATGTGSLYAWKGAYLLELSYVNTAESEKTLKASAEKVLPSLAKAIAEKLPGGGAPPPAVAKLPTEGQLPLGVVMVLQGALTTDGTGPAAFGFYKEGDKRYRVMVIAKDDPDQAKDVLKTFAKKKGASEEKSVGETGARLMVQEDDGGPKAEWFVAKKGKVVVGVGDETFALKPGASAAEHEKVSLSKDDKLKKLRAALDAAAKLDPEEDPAHAIRPRRAAPPPVAVPA